MTLNKNFLADAENNIKQHSEALTQLSTTFSAHLGRFLGFAKLQAVVISNAERELAVFRMLEEALSADTFVDADVAEIVKQLSVARKTNEQALAEILSPAQLEQVQKVREETALRHAKEAVPPTSQEQ